MAIPEKYKKIISSGVIASLAAGPLGAFSGPFDAGAIAGIWTTMFISIANKSGHMVDSAFAKKFISTIGTGFVGYYGGCKVATWIFHLIPGAGTLAAMGISTVMNGIFTLKFGSAVASLMNKNDFDVDDAAQAASTVLLSLCTVPTLGEWKELIYIKKDA